MSKKEMNDLPESVEEAPEAKAPRVEVQKKLEEKKVISDALIPSGQLLVEKGRSFIAKLTEQALVSCMVPASAGGENGIKEFSIQGVKILVPAGKPVNVPESVAALIRDVYNY